MVNILILLIILIIVARLFVRQFMLCYIEKNREIPEYLLRKYTSSSFTNINIIILNA